MLTPFAGLRRASLFSLAPLLIMALLGAAADSFWHRNAIHKISYQDQQTRLSTPLPAEEKLFHLTSISRVTLNAGYAAPVWSPMSASQLALTKTDYQGVYLLSLGSGGIRKLTDDLESGYNFRWTSDGEYIVYRSTTGDQNFQIKLLDPRTAEIQPLSEPGPDIGLPQELPPGFVAYRDGNAITRRMIPTRRISPRNTAGTAFPFVFQRNDEIFLSVEGSTKRISSGEGKYFLPLISPNGCKTVYQEISRGLYVYDFLEGTQVHVGRGESPAWSPDSKYLAYEVTSDDGHRLLSSDLFIAAIDGTMNVQLTRTPQLLERRPSWSLHGDMIAFDADGAIYTAKLIRNPK